MEPNRAVETSSKVDILIIVMGLKNKLLDILLINIFETFEGTYGLCEKEMEGLDEIFVCLLRNFFFVI
jgi:hypothetical protein